MTEIFSFTSQMPCSQQDLFDWHARPGAFERLTPYWEPVQISHRSGTIKSGDTVKLSLNVGPIKTYWHLVHDNYQEPKYFCDKQIKGPFKSWLHEHIFTNLGHDHSQLEDKIQYQIPLGLLGKLCAKNFIQAKLNRLFTYRHRVTLNDIKAINLIKERKAPMKILISGSSGLVGSELISFLGHQGHSVTRLLRDQSPDLEGFDAIIHLAGENIANKRWTEKQKILIKESRVKSTDTLARAISKLKTPPKVFICASAIGFYGDRPDEYINESSVSIKGDFLSETCQAWEDACAPARDAGIRTVNARFGVILSPKGGMLAKILPIFQLGGGGIIGNGKQIMSWIAIDDVVYALNYVMHNESVKGPINFTAPQAVSNQEFTKTLGKVIKRPTIFPVPSFAAKLAFGEMADALLLSSARVKPQKLIENGYEFAFPDLEEALKHML